MEIGSSQIGALLIEGKTKRVHALNTNPNLCYVLSKDRITAGDGAKSHQMVGKARISTQTNCAVFEFLNACGVPTAFESRVKNTDDAFVAKRCEMIPIEFVSRRVATGSFLKRHPNVPEGYRFTPVKTETFFKDDANHDPFWSDETIIGARLELGGVLVTENRLRQMLMITKLVFELLERAWATADHALIDMKIEFGVSDGRIIVGDVIDNDSWRLWPNGDKRLMVDKQIYRNLEASQIDTAALEKIRDTFEGVAIRTQNLFRGLSGVRTCVAIMMGSKADSEYCACIENSLKHTYGVCVEKYVCSAHKAAEFTLKVASGLWHCACIIAVAGRSNGLGPVVAAATPLPVISAPPAKDPSTMAVDVWSSLRAPSEVATPVVLGAENAALAAAMIAANQNAFVWGKIRTRQVMNAVAIIGSNE